MARSILVSSTARLNTDRMSVGGSSVNRTQVSTSVFGSGQVRSCTSMVSHRRKRGLEAEARCTHCQSDVVSEKPDG